MNRFRNPCAGRTPGLVAVALAAVLALSLGAVPARASNLWFDFDHDNNLATIQPRSASVMDTLSVVLDLSGMTVAPAFTLSINVSRDSYCVPNGGNCAGTYVDPGSIAAEVDSIWLEQTSRPCQPLTETLTLHFTSVPGPGPTTVAKVILTYPPEGPYCSRANQICFDTGAVDDQPIGVQLPIMKCVKVHDANVAVPGTTWGRLRGLYR